MSAAFLVTSLVIVAIPGTGALLTISAGLARGPSAAVVTAFGCTLGIVPHLLAAATGAAALLRASGTAFDAVKAAGVAYLLLMALQTWRDGSPLAVRDAPPRSAARVVGSAVTANLLNPKLTIFFFTFLPLFIPAGTRHPDLRLLGLSGIFMAMTFAVFVVYGLTATALRHRVLERPAVVRRIRRTFAVGFVGLGARLAVTARS